MNPVGLYIHVPFCRAKCPYCDFYSLSGQDGSVMDAYVDALVRAAGRFGTFQADTLYLGGGTPTLLGPGRLERLLKALAPHLLEGAEITLEANPGSVSPELLERAAEAGVNRLSLGVQTAAGEELRLLGRAHTNAQVEQAVRCAKAAGIGNLSGDLMLAIPGQTGESLEKSVDFLVSLGVSHVSAYLLKIEAGTPFARRELSLPDEDKTAALYLKCVELLERAGYRQYEISNFALPGRESRHNLKYWNDEEYLGLGPAAHSFFRGRRFFYPRDMKAFLAGISPTDDGPGGGEEEYCMLRLRLTEGLTEAGYRARFGAPIPEKMCRLAAPLAGAGLLKADQAGIHLTPGGFLVSNSVIARLLSGLS